MQTSVCPTKVASRHRGDLPLPFIRLINEFSRGRTALACLAESFHLCGPGFQIRVDRPASKCRAQNPQARQFAASDRISSESRLLFQRIIRQINRLAAEIDQREAAREMGDRLVYRRRRIEEVSRPARSGGGFPSYAAIPQRKEKPEEQRLPCPLSARPILRRHSLHRRDG